MIKIEAIEDKNLKFDLCVNISGNGAICTQELTAIFEDLHKNVPKVFMMALADCSFVKEAD